MGPAQTTTRKKDISLRYADKMDLKSTSENPLDQKSVSSQDSQKYSKEYKVAVVGVRAAVGKSALIQSLIAQNSAVSNVPQTLGFDVQHTTFNNKRMQFWELESNDVNVDEWENRINEQFACIILVFDQFNNENAAALKYRVKKLQKICNENKMTGRVPIRLVGNDRLDMRITGKERDIQKSIDSLYDGNRIYVHVVDFTQVKELNNLMNIII